MRRLGRALRWVPADAGTSLGRNAMPLRSKVVNGCAII
jgi:hypothetical protein